MLTGPGADLCGVPQHLVQRVVAVEHEGPQPLPVATRHLAGRLEFQQVHRLAVQVTDAVLGENRQALALEPFTREQRAIVIEQKTFGAAGHGPAACYVSVEYRGGPA
ncbi:hypothetical protein D3C80_1651150 [compost metagenome]